MASNLSIRLGGDARKTLEAAASRRGVGLSSYVRELAEAEASRLRRDEIRAQGERFLTLVAADPDLASEHAELGTPQAVHPGQRRSWAGP